VELVFVNVQTVNIKLGFDLTPSGTVEKNKIVFSFSEKPYATDFMIEAQYLKYKMFAPNDAVMQIEKNIEMQRVYENVAFINDTTILYTSYSGHEMIITMNKYPDGIILDSATIQSWLSPNQDEFITDMKKADIQKSISIYLDKKGVAYGWI
jgi:hypothetical protein